MNTNNSTLNGLAIASALVVTIVMGLEHNWYGMIGWGLLFLADINIFVKNNEIENLEYKLSQK